ncbi:MAG TPA: hypothetical protein ENI23_06095 [bacterium]|nr:hypothetical protein [bacterium]
MKKIKKTKILILWTLIVVVSGLLVLLFSLVIRTDNKTIREDQFSISIPTKWSTETINHENYKEINYKHNGYVLFSILYGDVDLQSDSIIGDNDIVTKADSSNINEYQSKELHIQKQGRYKRIYEIIDHIGNSQSKLIFSYQPKNKLFVEKVIDSIKLHDQQKLEYETNYGDKTNWEKIITEKFTLYAPPDWKYLQKQGIDSYVGEIKNSTSSISFDYGWYSNPLDSYNDDPYYSVTHEKIDGYEAKIIRPIELTNENFAGLFIDLDGITKLNLSGSNLTKDQIAIVLEIFRTLEFTE